MFCKLFVSVSIFFHANGMNFDSIEILSDGSLEKPDVHDADGVLITQVRTAHEKDESPIRENLGTSLAEKSQIDKDSVQEAKWVLDLLKVLPDVRERLASSVVRSAKQQVKNLLM